MVIIKSCLVITTISSIDLLQICKSVWQMSKDLRLMSSQIRREVDYRAICNYLNSEIFHLISSVDDPQVKAWARKIVTNLHNMVGKDIL